MISKADVQKKIYRQDLKESKKELKELEKEHNILLETRQLFQKAATLTQNYLVQHLSKIVTSAIKAVFPEKNIEFKMEFVERRGKTECDIWLEEDREEYDILGSRGYGIADIASFALRVAYILLHKNKNVLIQDEPFRNLGARRHSKASQMIKTLAEEFSFQFIIGSHSKQLKEYSDRNFEVTLEERDTSIVISH